MSGIRVAMILPGVGRVQRGAETAFIELARSLSRYPEVEVELFGSGRQGVEGLTIHTVPCVKRERFERWPRFPCFRSDTHYEECSFALGLVWSGAYRAERYDAVISCTYPFVNWYLERVNRRRGPVHVYVTQNGDWPCRRLNREYRSFACDGLVCTNPEYFERHRDSFNAALIPNGVDPVVYCPSGLASHRNQLGLPEKGSVVLMASALIPSKRVADGVRAVAAVAGASLVVVGDGPDRVALSALATTLLPGRHLLLGSVARERMADLYRQADVFLHMSQEEPFGIVYLEAAASGLPVVAHDGPVPRWILGDTALFANTSDLVAVADSLRRALAPNAHASFGQAGRERVLAGWTWEQQARRYREFISMLIARRSRPTNASLRVRGADATQVTLSPTEVR